MRAQLSFIGLRGGLRSELAADAVLARRGARNAFEQRLDDEPVVALGVLRIHAALVAVPQLDRAPVREQRGEQLVRAARGVAPREREVRGAAALQGLGQDARDLLRRARGGGLGVSAGGQAGPGAPLSAERVATSGL